MATLYSDRRYRILTLPVRARRRIELRREERSLCLLPGEHRTQPISPMPVPVESLPPPVVGRGPSGRVV